MENKLIIIGCGTGRCGTVTLSILLDSQEGFRIGHESIRMPWDFDGQYAQTSLEFFKSLEATCGDVASWYLPYVKYYLQHEDRVKIICLKRDREEVVRSFLTKTGWKRANHWTSHNSIYYREQPTVPQAFDMHFPKYDLPSSLALVKYWDEYYKKAEALERRFDGRFKIFDMGFVLNTDEGQRKLFSFIEVSNPNIYLGLKANRHDSFKMIHKIWMKKKDDEANKNCDIRGLE